MAGMSTTSKISTNVRFLWNRTLARISPAEADRKAVDQWATPYRRPPSAPLGKPFRIGAGLYDLSAWDEGEGPTVLLIHGWNGHAGQMRAFVEPLLAAGYHVVGFDHPAHGGSSGDRATLPDMVEAVRAVAWRVRPLHAVIAHSLGATAVALALTQDVRVERAVLMAPPVEMTHHARGFARALGFSPEGMLRELRHRLGADLDTFDLRRHSPTHRTPILVMHDPDDAEVPYAPARALAEMWPDTELQTVAGAGHRKMLANPDVVAAAVEFVKGSGAIPSVRQKAS